MKNKLTIVLNSIYSHSFEGVAMKRVCDYVCLITGCRDLMYRLQVVKHFCCDIWSLCWYFITLDHLEMGKGTAKFKNKWLLLVFQLVNWKASSSVRSNELLPFETIENTPEASAVYLNVTDKSTADGTGSALLYLLWWGARYTPLVPSNISYGGRDQAVIVLALKSLRGLVFDVQSWFSCVFVDGLW